MVIVELADIAGDNGVHQIATTGVARAVYFSIATGSGVPRIGSSTTSSSKGIGVPTAGLVLQEPTDLNDRWALSSIYAYVPSGTTLSVSYGI